MNRTIIRSAILACSSLGIALSAYLTLLTLRSSGVCLLNTPFSCEPVLTSSFSTLGGIPVATIGLAWFSVATAISAVSFLRPIFPNIIFYWAIIGVAGVVVMVLVEVFLINAICILCTAAHSLGVAILVLAYLLRLGLHG